MLDTSIGFIIDNYNKFHKNDNVVKVFHLYGKSYCIRRVENFNWGQPDFPEKDIEDEYLVYHVYNTLEEAEKYVSELRHLGGRII